ncbi:MAG: hypothetical protein JXB85_07140 [Anaerolineales bacterium]|nr:hypothetical protein [Anaerolineales bacterium]
MCLAVEFILLGYGIYVLVTGKYQLSKNIMLTGSKARIAGAFLVLPLPLAFGAGLLFGLLLGTGILPYSIQNYAVCLEGAIVLACMAGSFVFAYANKPPAASALQSPQEPPAVPPAP